MHNYGLVYIDKIKLFLTVAFFILNSSVLADFEHYLKVVHLPIFYMWCFKYELLKSDGY